VVDRKSYPIMDNDPVDPTRRRVLQGAFGLAFGLALPAGRYGLHRAQRPACDMVHVNQAGYLPSDPKRAVVACADALPSPAFTVVDDDTHRAVRYSGTLKPYEAPDGEPYGPFASHCFADFDTLRRPGHYRIRLANNVLSPRFTIGPDTFSSLRPLMLDYFALQRCGEQVHPLRAVCHRDDGVIRGGPRDGAPFDASGGWHDAGDYLKFVETSSYVTALFLFALDRRAAGHESSEGIAATVSLRDHARAGVEWLLKMHPAPDEFYFQVGDEADHDTWRLPEADCPARVADWKPRPVFFGVGANLAGRCAAAFAMASRLFRGDDPRFASRCRAAAESVYALGSANRSALSTEPQSFYPEETWADDMAWGAAELFRATGDRMYLAEALEFAHEAGAAGKETSVYNTHALAHYTLWSHAPRQHRDALVGYLEEDAKSIRDRVDNPFGLATPYIWGTAEAAAGCGISCLLYAELSGDTSYADVARRQRDFVLGCNPFGTSFLIGAGSRYPHYPHHQIANINGLELKGALVGGPASPSTVADESISLSDPAFSNMVTGPEPPDPPENAVAVYNDAAQDYVTNEPANDYTAKFFLLNEFYC